MCFITPRRTLFSLLFTWTVLSHSPGRGTGRPGPEGNKVLELAISLPCSYYGPLLTSALAKRIKVLFPIDNPISCDYANLVGKVLDMVNTTFHFLILGLYT
jgi:hypothetical protein